MTTKIDYSLPTIKRVKYEKNVNIYGYKIHPNTWNAKVRTPAQQEAIKGSLEMFGQSSDILVRAHPHIEGEYELIDGEGRKLVDLTSYSCTVVSGLTEEECRLMTASHESYGEQNEVKYAANIKMVQAKLGDRTFTAIPFTAADIEKMQKAAQEKLPPEASGDFVNLIFSIPRESVDEVEAAIDRVAIEGDIKTTSDRARKGMALVYLCIEYLGG
jgi:hypothetical protein